MKKGPKLPEDVKAFIWLHHQRELYSCQAEYYIERRAGVALMVASESQAQRSPRGFCTLLFLVQGRVRPGQPGGEQALGSGRTQRSPEVQLERHARHRNTPAALFLSRSHLSDFLSRGADRSGVKGQLERPPAI
jgi:hypothetical protein